MSASYLLMRHGDADWKRAAHCIGWGADIAPLSSLGRQQVQAKLKHIEAWRPTAIVCSPMTRALETAVAVAQHLSIPLQVYFELHEWIPKLTMDWKTLDEVISLQKDLLACDGEWPKGETRAWEPISQVRARALSVLSQLPRNERILVVAHGVLMYSLTNKWEIANCETIEFELPKPSAQ